MFRLRMMAPVKRWFAMTNKPGKASVEPLPQVNPLYLIAVIHTILVPMNWTYRGPEVVPSPFLSVVCFAAPM